MPRGVRKAKKPKDLEDDDDYMESGNTSNSKQQATNDDEEMEETNNQSTTTTTNATTMSNQQQAAILNPKKKARGAVVEEPVHSKDVLQKTFFKKQQLPFKKPNWSHPSAGKIPRLGRFLRLAQIIEKEKVKDPKAPTWSNIEAGPSVIPPKKYCDLTSFQSNYQDPRTRIRYAKAEQHQFIKSMDLNTIDKILSIRNASMRLK